LEAHPPTIIVASGSSHKRFNFIISRICPAGSDFYEAAHQLRHHQLSQEACQPMPAGTGTTENVEPPWKTSASARNQLFSGPQIINVRRRSFDSTSAGRHLRVQKESGSRWN
jgi:hypothetical protein